MSELSQKLDSADFRAQATGRRDGAAMTQPDHAEQPKTPDALRRLVVALARQAAAECFHAADESPTADEQGQPR